MTDDLILLDVQDAVATVTLNNPTKRGALSFEAMQRLTRTFDELAVRRDVHAIIFASLGSVFSSGHDLKEMQGDDRSAHEVFFTASAELMLAIRRAPQPVIAQVHANVAAAGCQIVAGCDLAVAAEGVEFSIAGLRIGMFPTLPAVALSRTMGDKMAMRLLLAVDSMTAEEALTHGLVSHVVPADEIEQATMELARRIAGFSTSVIGLGKQAYYAQAELDTDDAYRYAVQAVCDNVLLPDGQEGITAFLEKRPPKWRHSADG